MTICCGRRPRNHVISSTALLFCSLLISLPVSQVRADDQADKANRLLDNLKKRSPEERWQRVKKQYSVDSSAPPRITPSWVNERQPKGLTDAELPPSPEQTNLIPQLSALPVDASNDWVLPARDPVALLDEFTSETALESTGQNAVSPSNPQPGSAQTTGPAAAAPPDGGKTGPSGDVIVGESRPPSERKITDINPYYDRDRDSDIRDFAMVKGREWGLQYKNRVYVERAFPEVVLPWEASNYFYHPLYFSDPALERYGHAHHPLIQPICSIARFGTQFVFLPYQMAIDQPCAEQSPLGWYRPGDCVPKLHYPIPLNAEAALVEASAIAGLYFLIVP